ncbi:MAG: M1 family metallopeptidase [Bacteroidales bacterium]|nr:M1 family metallopeptidase [Bacteroidales bacterium]
MKNFTLMLTTFLFTILFHSGTHPLFRMQNNDILKVVLPQNSSPEADALDVKFYFIDIEVNDSTTHVSGSTTVHLEVLSPLKGQIILDMGNNLYVDSVLLNGQQADHVHQDDQLFIYTAYPVSDGNMMAIQVFYSGSVRNRSSFAGIYNEMDRKWDKRVTWTLSEPFSSRIWFPCKQDLTDKADSVYVFITTDKNLKAGSNGLLTAERLLPGDKIRYEWKSRYPVAFYLISFAVSDYRDYSFYTGYGDNGDSLLVQNFIYDNDLYLETNRSRINITSDLIRLFSDLFGPYPFRKEKYGHCIVPSGGGMEHQTMTTLEDFSFTLVTHELAHQWFGNYVTCATWQDIWINEGFASYSEYLGYEYLISREDADRWMDNAHVIVKFRNDGSVYVPENAARSENRIFDYRLTYKKGAAIVHMIRHEINNDDLFFEILQDFLNMHRHSSATGLDFKNLLEQKSGKDFTDFFNHWYFGEGYPVVSLQWQQHNDTLYINARQSTTSSTPLFRIPIDFRITAGGKDTVVTVRQNENNVRWAIHIPGTVTGLQADPDKWLLADFYYENDSLVSFLPGKGQHQHSFNVDIVERPKIADNIIFPEKQYNLFPFRFVKD